MSRGHPAGGVLVRLEVRPRWPFRLSRRRPLDGLDEVRGGVRRRLVRVEGELVLVAVAQSAPERVVLAARAADRGAAEEGLARMRRALGLDLDLRPFHERFRFDRLIGPSLRARPWLRPRGCPGPFQALAWAICEQLIEYERAAAIERRLVARLGPRCPATGLRDCPTPEALADEAPARLEADGLSASRAVTLVRAAREVSGGRVDLEARERPERGWRRLRAIPGVGSWTVQTLAFTGQGRLDQLPAGDLAYLKLVGRLLHGDPRARAREEEVERFFAPYEPWQGLAGLHALGGARGGRLAVA